MGSREDREEHGVYVELRNFKMTMELLGAAYDHENALKIFKALDITANGRLSFKNFMNWVYALPSLSLNQCISLWFKSFSEIFPIVMAYLFGVFCDSARCTVWVVPRIKAVY